MKNKIYIILLVILSTILSASVHPEHIHNHFDYTENQLETLEKSVQFEGSYYGFDEDDFLLVDEPSIPLESVITFIVNEPPRIIIFNC